MSELNGFLNKIDAQILELEKALKEKLLIKRGLLDHMEDEGISTASFSSIENVSTINYESQTENSSSLHPVKKRTLRAAVEEACQSLQPEEMLVADIEEILRKNNELPSSKSPRASIAMVMKKLVDEGLMVRAHVGTGSEPHRFKIVDNQETSEEKGEEALFSTNQ